MLQPRGNAMLLRRVGFPAGLALKPAKTGTDCAETGDARFSVNRKVDDRAGLNAAQLDT
jgi:hypothetical protein